MNVNIWAIVLEVVFGLVSAILAFALKEQIKENKRIKTEQEKAEKDRIAKEKERETALENGVVCILRKHLMDEHESWTQKGYITPKALESNIAMYKAYKGLGGNGMIDHMEEEIQCLPIHD